jgi:glycosyltransferase involved in cell wall biosynthesis
VKIALATDAWHPQVNGVVRALSMTVEQLRRRCHHVHVIEPSQFWTVPCPSYPEIRLALACRRSVWRTLDEQHANAVHIATEGPIGWAARAWCLKRKRPCTTSFHTRFPDYVSVRTGIPTSLGWAVMRRFHAPADRTFVVTSALAAELQGQNIDRTHVWPLGVDTGVFNPAVPPHPAMAGLPRPIMLSVGRVAVEKNIEAFLSLDLPGSKVVVGDGPALQKLNARYPTTLFLGLQHGTDLASTYTAADVFVFPSRTDTFGLVMIEALACGLPIAAFPVPGPIDILGWSCRGLNGGKWPIGSHDEDLTAAIQRALSADRHAAAREGAHYRWEQCTDRFEAGLSCDYAAKTESRLAA